MKESQYIDISTTAHSFVAFYGKAKITPVTSLEDTLSRQAQRCPPKTQINEQKHCTTYVIDNGARLALTY